MVSGIARRPTVTERVTVSVLARVRHSSRGEFAVGKGVNLGPGCLTLMMRGFSFHLQRRFAWQTADFLARIAERMRIIMQGWPTYEAYSMH